MRSACNVYAVCLCRGCVNAVGCHFVEKHKGLAASTEWAGLGLGLGAGPLEHSMVTISEDFHSLEHSTVTISEAFERCCDDKS